MMDRFFLSNAILVMTAAILFYAAMTDLKHYKIRNELIIALVVLFFLHSFLSGRWTSLPWNVGLAVLIFVATVYFYSRNAMGGGDVKLLTVAFLWVGIDCALPFAILLLLFATIHAFAAKFGWTEVSRAEQDTRARIPYAPSVAAALIGVFMLGCLAPIANR
jgi:prepilin peptidase CpaA